ncbi:MAG: tRNA pseudouridine(54/55) synthase Pus10 [Candidatus Helarchaeota archaeon]
MLIDENKQVTGWQMHLIETVEKLLHKYSLCNKCLGRQFALLGRNISNYQRGESLKLYLTLIASELNEVGSKDKAISILKILATHGGFSPAISTLKHLGEEPAAFLPCYICEGFMDEIEAFKDLILDHLQGIEYNTFLVGSQIPSSIIEREDSMRAEFNIGYGESIKAELNREIGKRLQSDKKEVDFNAPDVVAIVNPVSKTVDIQINPLFIFGRYRKLERGISQTRWICWSCEGKGCEECGGIGLRYEYSVEVLVCEPILKASSGSSYKFHGAGREDIDARMLGTGRPFVVEIKEPLKRNLNLDHLTTQINELASGKIEVSDLKLSDRGTIRNLKSLSQINEKTYRLLVETQDKVTLEQLEQADAALSGATIQQKTPLRVLHRRANKVRMKKVYEFSSKLLTDNKLEIVVRCQGGCYVKELVTGDDGRTQPNLSALLNTPITVLELDVINVES